MARVEGSNYRDFGKFIPGALVVLVGAVLLTSSLGFVNGSFWPNLWRLWPAGVVALGTFMVLRRPYPLAARLAGAGIVAGTVLTAAVLSATGVDLEGPRIHFNRFEGRVIGSGHMVTVERSLPLFHRIEVDGSTDVEVTIGGPSSALLTIDDNLLDVVRTDVSGGTLHVWAERQFSGGGGVLRVTAPDVEEIEIRGSGDAVVRGLDGGRFESNILGSGDIHLEGVVDVHDINILGSGELEASGLTSRHVGVLIAGSGSARVDVEETIDVRIVGSGNLEHSGGQIHDQTVVGSGTVRRIR